MHIKTRSFNEHLIKNGSPIRSALTQFDYLAADAILFVVDDDNRLMGSVTDGDVRRGLLKGYNIDDTVDKVLNESPKFIKKDAYNIHDIITYRNKNYKIIPVLNAKSQVINVINFRYLKSYLPLDTVIMAGGRGKRLSPLTDKIPKPLLKVGDTPIIEHNINRLTIYGVDDFWISLGYLGEQIKAYLGTGKNKNVQINYIWENYPLGTIGAVKKAEGLLHDNILVTNSDLLTNLNYEKFFLDFIEKDAALSIATIPYSVKIPYAVLKTSEEKVISFEEKPSYTYYSNAGIYLLKKEILQYIPKERYYDSTDLIESLLKEEEKVISYPLHGYWLDIGKPEDYQKAQKDIKLLS